jgi:hypothetical protein
MGPTFSWFTQPYSTQQFNSEGCSWLQQPMLQDYNRK